VLIYGIGQHKNTTDMIDCRSILMQSIEVGVLTTTPIMNHALMFLLSVHLSRIVFSQSHSQRSNLYYRVQQKALL